MRSWMLVLALLLLAGVVPVHAQQPLVLRETWRDAARDRTGPVKIFVPRDAVRHPVIVFSHGLGATREAYEYLGNAWARAGFVTVCLQHAGTDAGIYRPGVSRLEAMQRAVTDPALARARP